MKNVKIELVKTVGKLDYFLVTSEKGFMQSFCFYPEDEEKTKEKAILYAKELRDADEYEIKTLIEF